MDSLERLVTQEQRLGAVREQLRDKFSRSGVANPVELLDRLTTLQKRCSLLKDNIHSLTKEKHKLFDALAGQNAAKALWSIPVQDADIKEDQQDLKEVQEKMEKLLGTKIDYYIPPVSEQKMFDHVLKSRAELELEIANAEATIGFHVDDAKENAKDAGNTNGGPSDAFKQSNQKEYTIDKDSFEALPESVRGRAKLGEVQKALSVLEGVVKKRSKKNKNYKFTSIKDLDALGAKVVGHTGACVIASLRTLGFVEVSAREGLALI